MLMKQEGLCKRSQVHCALYNQLEYKRPRLASETSASTDFESSYSAKSTESDEEDAFSVKNEFKFSSSTKWTKEEDGMLRLCHAKFGRSWVKIASFVPNKNSAQCMQRWEQVLKPGIKKGSWTEAEDARLAKMVQKIIRDSPHNKVKNWKLIEPVMNGRTSKQCRERWTLFLNPAINRSPWYASEDAKLLQLQRQMGNKWSVIKGLLGTNRTENSVKLRFNKISKEARPEPQQMYQETPETTVEDYIEIIDILN